MPNALRTPQDVLDEESLRILLEQRRELTDEQLATLVAKVTPLVRRGDSLHNVDFSRIDPRNVAFTWTQAVTDVALNLEQHSIITTLHTFGAPSFFKPTIAEVLEMLPEDLPSDIVAFEVVGPHDSGDLVHQRVATDRGYHVARTILYARS
jgi:hypothetical protein